MNNENNEVKKTAEKLYSDVSTAQFKTKIEKQLFELFYSGFEIGYDIGFEDGILDNVE